MRFSYLIPFQVLMIILLSQATLVASNEQKKQYQPVYTDVAPEIDGVLDDEVWLKGTWDGGFTQFEPNNGRAPSQQTEFCILFDDNYLYVGIKAYDSAPDSIVRRLTRRDNSDGDLLGIALDSYFDLRTAFLLGVSAGGSRVDFVGYNQGSDDYTWDPNWRGKSSINATGWEVEMRIPLSELRFKKNGIGTWGLQVFRQIQRNGEMSFWQPTPADSPGLIHRFGHMTGMNRLQPRRLVNITPYLVSSAETYQSQLNNPFRPGRETHLKAGLDSKIGITNNFTLDLTVNPDFGQVEADPSEVNLTAFESFFQEKRPFFIEGRNITSFTLGLGDGGIGNDNLFYSRRIGRRPGGSIETPDNSFVDRPLFTNILGAAKLTGKTQQGLSLAIIQSVTGESMAEVDYLGERSFRMIEPLSNYFVARVQQDINDGNTLVGGMLTSTLRNTDDNLSRQMNSQAYSGGIDFSQYFFDKNWMFNINAAMSHVRGSEESILKTQRAPARYFQRPDATHLAIDSSRTSLSGSAGRVLIEKAGNGHWNMAGAVLWKSPGFEINDLGFMREADQVISILWAQYREWEPKGIYRSFNINGTYFNVTDFSGRSLESGVNASGMIRYRNFWSTNAGAEYSYGNVSKTMLRGGPAIKIPDIYYFWMGAGSDNRKKVIVNVSTNYNRGMENNAQTTRIGSSVTVKPAESFLFSFNPSAIKTYNQLQYVSSQDYESSTRYIFGSIDQRVINFSFRINYTLTPDLTVQYWGQPFIAAGKYSDFKQITAPMHDKFSERFTLYSPGQLSLSDDQYMVDEDLDGVNDYQFQQPDFKVREFLSNLVLRWEFNPGSSVYLVWNQTRSLFDDTGVMEFANDLDYMFSKKPHNIFLLKFTWRFDVNRG